jgi:UDP-glucuronate decarboxylase
MPLLASDIDEIVAGLPADFWLMFSGKRVLLTGGRGFLGRYFVEVFARLNAALFAPAKVLPVEVVVLDNMITAGAFGASVRSYPHVYFVEHDITIPFVPERPVDFILHAAGIASPAWYRKFPEETYRVSTLGTTNVLAIAKKNPGCRLAFFSSSEIYGDPDALNVPTQESYKGLVSCTGPRCMYDEGKRFGEMMIRVAHQQHGIQGVMIRPFNFYGPGMQQTDYRVLPNFAAKWMRGEPLQIYGTGEQTRTFCYVTDGIRGCLQVLALGEPGEPYNVGNPSPEISMNDLVAKIVRLTNHGLRAEVIAHPASYPADEPQRRCPDITKIQAHVGYRPLVALDDGLARFFGWAETAYGAPASEAAAE